jgi:hypothetical protein
MYANFFMRRLYAAKDLRVGDVLRYVDGKTVIVEWV